jgi:hypothetical protein
MFSKIRAIGATAFAAGLATVLMTLPTVAWFGRGFGFGGFGFPFFRGFGFGFPFFGGFGGFGFPFFNNFSFSSSLAFSSMFSGMGSFFW